MSGTLRLRGATSGYSELQAPAVAADQTFVLPTAGGTLLTTDSPVAQLTLELGSASQPSLRFEGDTDTGLFSSGANTLNLVTGGSSKVVLGADAHTIFAGTNASVRAIDIDSSGRVGINTSSPGSTLELSSAATSAAAGVTITNTNAAGYSTVQFKNTGASGRTYTLALGGNTSVFPGSVYLYDDTAGSSRVLVDSSGNVGIGTSSPQRALQVGIHGSGNGEIALASSTSGFCSILMGDGATGTDLYRGYIQYNNSSDAMLLATSATERMRIDSAGLVTIDSFTNTAGGISLRTGFAPTAFGGSGIMATDHSGSSRDGMALYGHDGISFHINGPSERMRIDGQGTARVLIGTTSIIGGTTKDSYYSKLTVVGRGDATGNEGRMSIVRDATSTASGVSVGNFYFADSSGNSYGAIVCSAAANSTSTSSPGDLRFFTTRSNDFNPGEKARIDSAGRFHVNNTAGNDAAVTIRTDATYLNAYNLYLDADATYAGHYRFMRFRVTASKNIIGSIESTNGTSTNYNTTSDYRLKENVVDITDGITRVKQLYPKRFNFIVDPDTTVDGFLAHEAQTVVPESITGTKDEVDDDGNPVMQGIDQSKLVPLLTAALQEAIAKIEILEQRLSDAGIA